MGIINDVQAIQSKFEFTMNSGDILLLYTDGLIEARNGNGEQFDIEGVKESFRKVINEDLEKIKDHLIKDVSEFAQSGDMLKYNGSFADDITLVLLKRK